MEKKWIISIFIFLLILSYFYSPAMADTTMSVSVDGHPELTDGDISTTYKAPGNITFTIRVSGGAPGTVYIYLVSGDTGPAIDYYGSGIYLGTRSKFSGVKLIPGSFAAIPKVDGADMFYIHTVYSMNIAEVSLSPTLPPKGIIAQAISATSVSISWVSPPSSVDHYAIYRDGAVIATVSASSTQYVDNTVLPNHTYTYVVAAVGPDGSTASSNPASVTTPLPPPPGSPTGLRVTGSTQTSVSLAWDPVPGAFSYTMLRDGVLENPSITGTSYTLQGLEPGHMYQISLSATDAYGQTGPEASITVSTQKPPPPGPPTGLHVTGVTTSSVSLSWDAQSGAVKYGIYRDGQHIATVTSTQYTDQGLASGTQYRYTISAIDGWNQEGPQSAPVTASTETPPPPPPAPPTGLRVAGSTQTSITVAWNPVSGAQTYTVYLSGNVYQAGVQGTTFTIGGLQPATQYSISVSATDAWGQEGAQNSVQGQTQLPDLLGSPGGLQETNATATTVSLSWSPVPGATGYAIYRDGIRIAQVSETSYTDTGLSPSSTHSYTVAAIDFWGREGAPSIPVTATTAVFDVVPPTVKKSGCTLSWSPAPGTPAGVEYIVYRNGFEVARTTSTTYAIPDCSDISQYTVAVAYQGAVSPPSAPVGGIGIDARTSYGFTASDLWDTTIQILLSLGSLLLLAMAIWLAPRIRDTLKRLYERRRQERWWTDIRWW